MPQHMAKANDINSIVTVVPYETQVTTPDVAGMHQLTRKYHGTRAAKSD